MQMAISIEGIVMFALTTLLAIVSWGVRQRYTEVMNRMDGMEDRQDAQQREIDKCATSDSLAAAIRSTNTLIEAMRESVKRDIDNLRQNEIKEIYTVMRDENRAFRRELNEGLNAVRQEIARSAKTTANIIRGGGDD